MDNWDVFLMDVFLVDNRLDVFVDDWSVMLVNHILVEFVNNVLMMFMDYFSV